MQKQQKILEEDAIESSSEEFQILDSAQILKQSGQSLAEISPTISIKLNGVYIVIPHSEAQVQYANEQEWSQLLSKNFVQRKSQISVIGLNSIIGIDKQFSKQNWNKMITELKQQQKYICDEQAEFSIKIIKEVQKNVQKMFKRIGFKEDNDCEYAKTLIIHTISLYQLREPHLGVLKGLQYICYGIFRCFDKKTAPQIYDSFAYLMIVQDLREVFYNSSQLFYAELDQLCQELQMEVPKLYQYLVEAQADWSMIFVSYYRSLLLYGIQSEIVARKILDLIAVYGIQIIRIILVRIISKRQEELLQMNDPQKIMAILGTSLISHEFEPELQRKRGKKNKKHEKQDNYNQQLRQSKSAQEDKKEKETNDNWQRVVEKFRRIIIGI